jgi:hypothetical protein
VTEQELFGLLKRCLASQLDEITVRMGLDSSSLPSRNEAPATRAVEILSLARQQADGLAGLESLLTAMFRRAPSTGPDSSSHCTILVLSSNPQGTSPLDLNAEIAAISEAILEGPNKTGYEVQIALTANPQEISRYLLEFEPALVHFAGHGSEDGQVLMQNEDGEVVPVNPKALARLFDVLACPVRCIFLNACYSYTHASVLARSVSCVVGMAHRVGDDSAIEFARGFYRALSFGRMFETAFQVGCSQIDLLSLPDLQVPRIWTDGKEYSASTEYSRLRPSTNRPGGT